MRLLDSNLQEAIGKADLVVVGQVESPAPGGSPAKPNQARVKVLGDILGGHITMAGLGDVDVNIPPGDLPGRPNAEEEIHLPAAGEEAIFFLATPKVPQTAFTLLSTAPTGMVMASALPGIPLRPRTLEELLLFGHTIVIGQFTKFEERFEHATESGATIKWWQKCRGEIAIKKTVRGTLGGRIDGELQFEGSDERGQALGPRPVRPDMSRDYILFLNVHEPRAPSEPHSDVLAVLTTDAFRVTPDPKTQPPAPAKVANLPLPGSDLSLDDAKAQARTIVVGRVSEITVFYTDLGKFDQFDTIRVTTTLRGKVGKSIQYDVPVRVGRESGLEMGKSYLFLVGHYGTVLKVGPADALSSPAPKRPGGST